MTNIYIITVSVEKNEDGSNEDYGTHMLGVYSEFGVAMKAISEDATKVWSNLPALQYGYMQHGKDDYSEYSAIVCEFGNDNDGNPMEVRSYRIYHKTVW